MDRSLTAVIPPKRMVTLHVEQQSVLSEGGHAAFREKKKSKMALVAFP